MLPGRFLALVSLIASASAALSQPSVQRCEATDGRVTYSNAQCPPGTAAVRTISTDPPVSAEERNAAMERARSDSAAVRHAAREQAQREARDQREAEARSKREATATQRCERARRDLERATQTREDLGRRAATVEKLRKADAEIGRREAGVEQDCAR